MAVEVLSESLEREGLALPVVTAQVGPTVGGMAQTGSHGSCSDRPPFDGMVKELR